MKTVAIIQARMGSNRLPGKVLMPIMGKPMLWHIVRRVRAAPSIDEVVVAVPVGAADEVLRQFCAANDIACFSGSELDVLDRYYRAAQVHRADPVLRITADCPFVDPDFLENLIALYWSDRYDYAAVAAGADAQELGRGVLSRRYGCGVFQLRIIGTGLERSGGPEGPRACDSIYLAPERTLSLYKVAG